MAFYKLRKLTEPLFQKAKDVGKTAANAFETYAEKTPLGAAVKGVAGGITGNKRQLDEGYNQLKSQVSAIPRRISQANPISAAVNVAPVAGVTKPIVKQIDNLTKDEIIRAIDYIRLKQPYSQPMEEYIGKLAEKFGINGRRYGVIANQLERLLERTKTKDVLGRVLK